MKRCVGMSFLLGSVSKDFTNNKQSKIFLNGTVCDFLLDHSSFEKEGSLSIQ